MPHRRFPTYIFGLVCLFFLAACVSPQAGKVAEHPGAEIPPGEVRLHQIHPDIWVHVSTKRFDDGSVFPVNGLVMRSRDELLLVDTAWGEKATRALLAAIHNNIGLPVNKAIITHFHEDKISGTPVLEAQGIRVYATPLTRRLASSAGNPVPSSVLHGLDVPGSAITLDSVEVFYPGAGHAPDNLIIYIPRTAVLFGGCAIHEASRTTPGNIADASLNIWPRSISTIQARYPDAKIIIPGHGKPGGFNLLNHTIAVIEQHNNHKAGE